MFRFADVEFAIFVYFLLFTTSYCGRYEPPLDLSEYNFPYDTVPSVDDLIINAGFQHELYKIVTEDGHILSLHRLRNPNNNNRGTPVLFVNGFCFQSEGWMGLGRNTSIAYILSDLGYDVWLGDQRGTSRSIGHVKYPLSDPRVFRYSFHEMGIYDLPAFIDHILLKTGHERLLYVGLSLGCGVFAVMESELPRYKDKILAAVFLGPALHLTNWNKASYMYFNILRIVDSMIESQIQRKLWILFANQYLIKSALSSCSLIPSKIYLSSCLTLVGVSLGTYTGNMKAATVGLQIASVVTSTSVFVAKHLLQVLKKGEFKMYDYGSDKMNLEIYGTPEPPNYNISAMTTPVMVFYGSVDNMASVPAVERSINDMSSTNVFPKLLSGFNHVDYIFGQRAPREVYVPMVDFFDKITGISNSFDFLSLKGKVTNVNQNSINDFLL